MSQLLKLPRSKRRVLIVIAAIIILPWAFLSTLIRELCDAFYYAWLETMVEFDAMRANWKAS
jgi:hypothetical protein